MNTKKLLLEQVIRYAIIFSVIALLWSPIRNGLNEASHQSNNLEAIAVIMGLVSICSLYGYFSFSYTTVGKNFLHRFIGYICASLLTVALLITWVTMYSLAVIWVPTMKEIWLFTFVVLYLGVFIFDILDLFRMGMDVAAVSFFERETNKSKLSDTIKLLKEGQRLAFANALIGKAILELGKQKNKQTLITNGQWIMDNSEEGQKIIDRKVAETFREYIGKNPKASNIIKDLNKGQNQSTADSLIANLLEIADSEKA